MCQNLLSVKSGASRAQSWSHLLLWVITLQFPTRSYKHSRSLAPSCYTAAFEAANQTSVSHDALILERAVRVS